MTAPCIRVAVVAVIAASGYATVTAAHASPTHHSGYDGSTVVMTWSHAAPGAYPQTHGFTGPWCQEDTYKDDTPAQQATVAALRAATLLNSTGGVPDDSSVFLSAVDYRCGSGVEASTTQRAPSTTPTTTAPTTRATTTRSTSPAPTTTSRATATARVPGSAVLPTRTQRQPTTRAMPRPVARTGSIAQVSAAGSARVFKAAPETLPNTGSDVGPLSGIAGLLLCAGAGLLRLGRRRRT